MNLKNINNYTFNKQLIVKHIGETVMAYNPENGDMYEMNEIAIALIEKLISNISGEQIIKDFCEEYNIDEKTIIEDTGPLLERFNDLGLLKLQ